ncbi:hypothetical protein E4U48_004169 [Claviceps purpurea]|nr:hypothetical protein E4U48_004169 [Claviceps purpurea]
MVQLQLMISFRPKSLSKILATSGLHTHLLPPSEMMRSGLVGQFINEHAIQDEGRAVLDRHHILCVGRDNVTVLAPEARAVNSPRGRDDDMAVALKLATPPMRAYELNELGTIVDGEAVAPEPALICSSMLPTGEDSLGANRNTEARNTESRM